MNAYVDSTVILRIALGQNNTLREWQEIETPIVSALVEVECLRTLDRVRLTARMKESEFVARRETIYRMMESVDIVEPTRTILVRASQPFPTALGTLDAIHLATALLWRERSGQDLRMATHDGALAMAARASGLSVLGP